MVLKTNTALDEFCIPRGKVTEIVGPEDSYKSYLALKAIRGVQDEGGIVLYIAADNGVHKGYLEMNKIDFDRLYVLQSNDYCTILDAVKALSSFVDLIIIDSIAAIKVKENAFKEIGSLVRDCSIEGVKHKTTFILLNQFRYNIERRREQSYCDKVFQIYASVRLRTSLLNTIKKYHRTIGCNVKLECFRHKRMQAGHISQIKFYWEAA